MEKQELFALFFAIFWGGIMNVSWRWSMFQPVMSQCRIAKRFALSALLMVVLPILFFVWQLQCLIGTGKACSLSEVIAAVLPALGIFACYRLWMVIIECRPKQFYWSEEECVPHHQLRSIDPSIEKLNISDGFTCKWNLGAAVFYGFVAVGIPLLIR